MSGCLFKAVHGKIVPARGVGSTMVPTKIIANANLAARAVGCTGSDTV